MRALCLGLLILMSAGCTKKTPAVSQTPQEKGRAVYAAHCLACHNVNPNLDGAVGPAVQGASLALLEARILKGTYPEGYKAKRTTAIMPPLPYLKDDIPALHAYLNAP